jgi:hypothetical protein
MSVQCHSSPGISAERGLRTPPSGGDWAQELSWTLCLGITLIRPSLCSLSLTELSRMSNIDMDIRLYRYYVKFSLRSETVTSAIWRPCETCWTGETNATVNRDPPPVTSCSNVFF